jgi:PAS domain S-box-containing protein
MNKSKNNKTVQRLMNIRNIINLASSNFMKKMQRKLFNPISRDPEFSESWLNSQKHILLALTIGGSIIVIFWQLFDKYYISGETTRLLWLRLITIVVYWVNLFIAFRRRTPEAFKQHLVAGFYFGAIFCMLLTAFTGASQSPYWFSLFFIIVGWFVLMPYNFREMILHSVFFVIIFLSGLIAQNEFEVINHEMAKIVFLYSGTLFFSFFAAYIRNILDLENLKYKKELRTKNEELGKFRQALNQVSGAVFIMDKNWNFEYINPWFTQISGYSADELLHRNIRDTLYKGIPDVPESRKGIIENLIQEKSWEGELHTINKNGTHYWANTIAAPFKNEKGEVDGYVVIQQDITEKKKMLTELSEREQLHRTLIEDSLEGVVIVNDFKFIFVNKAFTDMIGYTFDELNEMDPVSILATEDRLRILEYHNLRMQGQIDVQTYMADFIRKDGTRFTAETNSSRIEINGKMASYVTLRDITENRKMQEALQESEEKYRNLINKATDGIVITQNGLIKYANPAMCEMMQHSYDEMIEKPYLDYIVKEDHQVMVDYHKRRMAGEVFTSIYRSRFIRKNGSIITMELNARTSDYNGLPAAFIVIRDITDRLNIENELQDAKEALEKMNRDLEKRVVSSSQQLTEANMQLIRLQKENLQSQFEVLRQQVNPHFLFNSLNVLTSLIKLEPDLAEKFTEHLSKVYRYVLENKEKDLVKLRTELEFLEAYIFLLNIRFMDKIEIKVSISESENELLILPLALQLLIENAIKHNAMSKKNPLYIEIFIEDGNILNVVNNLQERESHMASTGLGLKNIEHRYKLLELPTPEFIKTETHFIAKVPLKNN